MSRERGGFLPGRWHCSSRTAVTSAFLRYLFSISTPPCPSADHRDCTMLHRCSFGSCLFMSFLLGIFKIIFHLFDIRILSFQSTTQYTTCIFNNILSFLSLLLKFCFSCSMILTNNCCKYCEGVSNMQYYALLSTKQYRCPHYTVHHLLLSHSSSFCFYKYVSLGTSDVQVFDFLR